MRNNRKQLLMDFYLVLLSFPPESMFRLLNQKLYASTRDAIAYELNEDAETVQNIFEKMALEDK